MNVLHHPTATCNISYNTSFCNLQESLQESWNQSYGTNTVHTPPQSVFCTDRERIVLRTGGISSFWRQALAD